MLFGQAEEEHLPRLVARIKLLLLDRSVEELRRKKTGKLYIHSMDGFDPEACKV